VNGLVMGFWRRVDDLSVLSRKSRKTRIYTTGGGLYLTDIIMMRL
jgi:hypothetical protein